VDGSADQRSPRLPGEADWNPSEEPAMRLRSSALTRQEVCLYLMSYLSHHVHIQHVNTLSLTVLSVAVLSVAVLSVTVLSVSVLSVKVLSVKVLSVAVFSVTVLSVTELSVAVLSVTVEVFVYKYKKRSRRVVWDPNI